MKGVCLKKIGSSSVQIKRGVWIVTAKKKKQSHLVWTYATLDLKKNCITQVLNQTNFPLV